MDAFNNIGWFWNNNNHQDQSVATTGMIYPPTSYYSSRSAVMTDVGICVGMRNVDLNTEAAAAAFLQPHRRQPANFNNACSEYLRHQAMYNGPYPAIGNRYVRPTAYQHGANYLTAPHMPVVDYGHSILTESVYAKPPAPPPFSANSAGNVLSRSVPATPYIPSPLPPGQRPTQPTTLTSGHFEALSNRLTEIQDHGVYTALRRRASFESPGTPSAITVAPKKKWMRHYMKEPFQNERTIPPPLVVISPHNHHHHPTHSLSPHSYDASRSRSSSLSSNPISANGVHHVLTAGEDSSQSSLNLSNASSGYLSGGSANSSVGGSCLNLSSSPTSSPNSSGTASAAATLGSLSSGGSPGGNGASPVAMNVGLNGNINGGSSNHLLMSSASQTQISNRRRTISSNSNNGGTQRSPCILRAGTREVHNKMEKNRRAQLKECFDQLKKQLPHNESEKKTSNLSILGNAYKSISMMLRKEKELEQEMEKLAKEKVAQHSRIQELKRDLTAMSEQGIVFPSGDADSVVRERFLSETLSEPAVRSYGRARYSSTSSLSSAATASSPCTAGIPTQSALTISSVIPNAASNSPQRPHSSSPTITSIPMFSTSKDYTTIAAADSPTAMSAVKISAVYTNGLPNGLTGHHHHQQLQQQVQSQPQHLHHNGNQIAINFTTSDGVTPTLLSTTTNASMPISLNQLNLAQSNGQALQIISTTTSNGHANGNGVATTKLINGKNGIRSMDKTKDGQKLEFISSSKMDSEPPKKVLKLINGNYALTVDKDSKLMQPGALTVSQVLVSPIHMIGQSSNGLATIELSNSNGQRNQNHQTGAQLHKLLVSGTTASSNGLTTSTTNTSELTRLPGGAELNILSTGTNGTGLYRSNNGKISIVNGVNGGAFTFKGTTADANGSCGRPVHMVTTTSMANGTPLSGLTPIVVSQGGHILASSQQLAAKVMTTPISVNGQGLPIIGTQYLSSASVCKPMVVTVAANGAGGTISLPITTLSSSNGNGI